MATSKQKLLPLADGPESRVDRVRRLLVGLGQKPGTITTAAEFDYTAATKIATGNLPSSPSANSAEPRGRITRIA